MYGNEAIARGAYEAGAHVATGYPGTPSTEIIEAMARYEDVYVEWSPNEKVALEVAIGASIGGGRAIACMKHVGVNVAADPLMTAAYMGVNGGLVLVTADDPGMHSSQNEQDNRWYGKFARVPVLEPADSAEARDFTAMAFEMSERFDTPVLLRSTTRISHARSPVAQRERAAVPVRQYTKNPAKFAVLPAHARVLKPQVLSRLEALADYAETTTVNRAEWPCGQPAGGSQAGKDRAKRGFITGGMAYNYVREAFPCDPIYKLGMSYPVPRRALQEFAARVETLYVVEELDAFWEAELRWLGIQAVGKAAFPEAGEFSTHIVRESVRAYEAGHGIAAAASGAEAASADARQPGAAQASDLPGRPPVLCPGCPHRGMFHVLRKLRTTVSGDIGCYTLGLMPPLNSMDTCVCMGASISAAIGLKQVLPAEQSARVVAAIGDSTFIHSGITGLIDAVYNRSSLAVVIMDNSTTAMTGHQGHPASGLDARRKPSAKVELEQIVTACGVTRMWIVDPNDLRAAESAMRQALEPGDGPAVVISRRLCALIDRSLRDAQPVTYHPELCIECGACLRMGCPALARDGKRPSVQAHLCVGCEQCVQVCPKSALKGAKGGDGGNG
jgi:indolepyruvate ferredoxin oxidoreductase alpha subunit